MSMAKFNWRRFRTVQKLHRFLYAIGLGPLIGRIILLLTTTGRKSGLLRTTPVQYEEIDGAYYIGAARGLKADWVKNIQANPKIHVQVKNLRFDGHATIVTDPVIIADFLEVRLERHPRMVGLMMSKAHKLPKRPTRAQLEELSKGLVIVTVQPNS